MDDDLRDDMRAAAADALIREGIALAIMAALLWAMGPGRVLLPAWCARGRALFRRPEHHGLALAEFSRRISEWDHEQTSAANSRPAR